MKPIRSESQERAMQSPAGNGQGAAPTTRISPFLLPMCRACGNPANLCSVEPHPTLAAHDLRTFACTSCGSQQDFVVARH
jgi:hypothetical protein